MAPRWHVAVYLAAIASVVEVHPPGARADGTAAPQAPPPVGYWFDAQRIFYEGSTIVVTLSDWYVERKDGQAPPDEQFSLEREGEEWVAVEHRPGVADRRYYLELQADGDLIARMKANSSNIVWRLSPKVSNSSKTGSLPELEKPGPIHMVFATLLGFVLLAGLLRVARVLRSLNVLSVGLRQVPEGMRTAECGACHTMQYVSVTGRIFICFDCHAANRIPRDFVQTPELAQPLIAPTGPLHSFQFRKGGNNYWQELKREEIPMPEGPEDTTPGVPMETGKLHYRGTYCLACSEKTCRRLSEFPTSDCVVACLPPVPGGQQQQPDDTRINISSEGYEGVEPQVLGRQADGEDMQDNMSNRSTRSNVHGLTQCVVCLDRLGEVVLLPCAHGSVCEECAIRIAQNRATGGAHCPHCRADIETLVKICQVEGDVAQGVELRVPIARAAVA